MSERKADRIRLDLEERGVDRDLSAALSARLEGFAHQLPAEIYEAVLAGVALASGEQAREPADAAKTARDLDEIHHLLGAFTDELRKLDEALETLAAYVLRMRSQPLTRDRTLH